MADCCVDVLAMIDAFHMDSRASAVRAMSVASPLVDQVDGRSVNVPLGTLCFSPCAFPTVGKAAAPHLKERHNPNQLGALRRLSPYPILLPTAINEHPGVAKCLTFLWSHSETSPLLSITNHTLIHKSLACFSVF